MVFQLWEGKLLLEPPPNLPVADHVDCCCDRCPWCTGVGMPAQIQVNLSGVADNDCSECDPYFNNSFILDLDPGEVRCEYEYHEDPWTCVNVPCQPPGVYTYEHVINITAQFTMSGADYILRVRVEECECQPHPAYESRCLERVRFEKNFGPSKPACLLVGVHALTRVDDSAFLCDWTSAACTVQAV